jgi:type IV pilus assembly protein PilW
MPAGVGVGGTSASTNGTSNDTIDIAFQTSGTDGLINCQGQTASTPTVFMNSFSINASNQLVCSMDGGATFITLASNVKSMTILYGVDSQGKGTVDSYLQASSMTAALWPSVRSVQITITFTNPLVSSKTLPWVQSINIMNMS